MKKTKHTECLRHKKRNTRGFTLVELIIVIAIIAVLAVVLVPTYQKYVARSREAVCNTNRTELARELTLAYHLDGRAGYEEEVQKLQDEDVCPEDGEITYTLDETNNLVTVSCSIHPKVQMVTDWDTQTMASVMEQMATATSGRGYADADSGAIDKVTGSRSEAIVAALAGQNIDLEALGASSWHYDYNNKMFYWTSVNISTLTPGTSTQIPTLRYNGKTGTYTVWYCTVTAKTTEGQTYNVLGNPQGYTPSTGNTAVDNQTYEQAQKYMDEALNKYNGY